MKPDPVEPEKQLGKDLQTFDKLPDKTKELHLLTDQAEKETGRNRAVLDRLIQQKSKRT